jgi:hypothetical protein
MAYRNAVFPIHDCSAPERGVTHFETLTPHSVPVRLFEGNLEKPTRRRSSQLRPALVQHRLAKPYKGRVL